MESLGSILRRPEAGAFLGLAFVFSFFTIFGSEHFLSFAGAASWLNVAANLGMIAIPIGFLMIAVTAGFAAVTYWLGRDPAPTVDPETLRGLRARVARRRNGDAQSTDGAQSTGNARSAGNARSTGHDGSPTQVMPRPEDPRPPQYPEA